MNKINNLPLIELDTSKQNEITGGNKIGSINLITSVITKETESTETKSFSIHWDESGISIQLQ